MEMPRLVGCVATAHPDRIPLEQNVALTSHWQEKNF